MRRAAARDACTSRKLAELVKRLDDLRVEFECVIPQARPVDGEPVALQPSQRLAERCTADLDAARQLALAQALPRPHLPGEDHRPQRVVGNLTQRFVGLGGRGS